MFKGFLTGFIIVVLAIAFILYGYGKKTMTSMSSAKTDAFVDSTTLSPNAAEATLMKKWVDYAPPTKKFKAKFPSSPQHATDRSTDNKTKELKQYEMYISENNGKVFMISVIAFLNKDAVTNEETILKGIVDDMVTSNPGNKLEKIQYGNFDQHKTAEFLISNHAYAITGRAFIAGNQLYVLSTLSKTAEEAKSEFDYFVNSFKLNSEPSNLVPFPIEK